MKTSRSARLPSKLLSLVGEVARKQVKRPNHFTREIYKLGTTVEGLYEGPSRWVTLYSNWLIGDQGQEPCGSNWSGPREKLPEAGEAGAAWKGGWMRATLDSADFGCLSLGKSRRSTL